MRKSPTCATKARAFWAGYVPCFSRDFLQWSSTYITSQIKSRRYISSLRVLQALYCLSKRTSFISRCLQATISEKWILLWLQVNEHAMLRTWLRISTHNNSTWSGNSLSKQSRTLNSLACLSKTSSECKSSLTSNLKSCLNMPNQVCKELLTSNLRRSRKWTTQSRL